MDLFCNLRMTDKLLFQGLPKCIMPSAQLGLRIREYILNDDFNLRNQHNASCVVRFVACNVWMAAAVLSLVSGLARAQSY